jgi:hypothetical protein
VLARSAASWHSRGVSESISDAWLSVPDVCERLGLTPGKVHRLVEQHALLGAKRDGVFCIPEAFLQGGEPLSELRGTVVVLIDGGFTQESALEWMLAENQELGASPIAALHQGRKTEVRRLAQALAL